MDSMWNIMDCYYDNRGMLFENTEGERGNN